MTREELTKRRRAKHAARIFTFLFRLMAFVSAFIVIGVVGSMDKGAGLEWGFGAICTWLAITAAFVFAAEIISRRV